MTLDREDIEAIADAIVRKMRQAEAPDNLIQRMRRAGSLAEKKRLIAEHNRQMEGVTA